MKRFLPFLLLAFTSVVVSAQSTSTHTVYFEHDQWNLTSAEKDKFLTWLSGISDTVKTIRVTGHTDHLGLDTYNEELSDRRANMVMELIETLQKFPYRMSLVSGEGEKQAKQIVGESDGIPDDRKVVITVDFPPKPIVKKKVVTHSEPVSESDLLVQAEVGQTVVLKNLNFFPGRHYLIPEAMPELERLITIMTENPALEIEIQGHICCKLDSIDAKDINTGTFSLSFNRAEYIFQQLVMAGIDKNRMKYRGFAGSRPLIEPELTEMDRNRNRRVEIKILKK